MWRAASLQVELMFLHVLERLLRHEMPHVAAFLDALADESGRNLNDRGLQYRDRRIIDELSPIVALTRKDQKLIVVKDFLVLAPVLEVLQAVHAADEKELAVGALVRECSQGINGIGRPGQMHLYVADMETRVVAQGELHHFQTLIVGQEVFLLLQGVLGRHYKPQLIQVGKLDQIVGQHHVTMMDGVEGTGINAYFFHVIYFRIVLRPALRPFDRLRAQGP